MKKLNWNKPITWKDYGIICAVVWVVSIIGYGLWAAYVKWDEITTWYHRYVRKDFD